MNTFAEIKPLSRYDKVAYYSVSIDGNEKSLFEEFIAKHSSRNKRKLNHILKWMQIIGMKYGAQTRIFRNEAYGADTSALPPKGKKREPVYEENGVIVSNNLRLYCLRASESVVFLFGGDIKTARNAQDCPNVKTHFKLANALTKAIDQAFRDKEISWIESGKLIDVEPGFKLKLEI